jgi:hypothetical protein
VADLPPKEKGIVAELLMIAERGRSDPSSRKSHSLCTRGGKPRVFFVMRRAAPPAGVINPALTINRHASNIPLILHDWPGERSAGPFCSS